MRAAIYHGPEKVSIEDIDKPTPGPKDVLVKTVRTGICGSDQTAYFIDGRFAGVYPDRRFGHETAGYIVEVGDEVVDFKVGDRVFIDPIMSMPVGEADMLGGFSDYILVSDPKIDKQLYLLPDELSYDDAALIEPISVGCHGKNIPGAVAGKNMVVFGAGPIGLSSLATAAAAGVKVAVIVRNNSKKEFIEKLGGIVCNTSEVDTAEFLKQTFGIAKSRWGFDVPDVDVWIEASGAHEVIDDFLKMCKPGARFSIVGVMKGQFDFPYQKVLSTEAVFMGSCGYYTADIKEVIDHLAKKKSCIANMIMAHYPLEKIDEAFQYAHRKEVMKVIIDME